MKQPFLSRTATISCWIRFSSVLAFIFGQSSLTAQTIDFETLPNGSPMSVATVVSDQFKVAPFGVSFRFTDGSFPVIRKVGGFNSSTGKPSAFYGWPNGTGNNTPAPGQNVGKFFLTDDRSVNDPPPPLVVTYEQAVAAASAFILDIDGNEAWDVYARNSDGQVIAQVHLEHDTPGTGDGIATPWSFSRPSADIKSIRIVYSGNPNANVGLAFDNFSPSTPLTPSGLAKVAINTTNGTVTLGITGTTSALYYIEAATSLEGPWQVITSIVFPADSSEIVLTDIEPLSARRFYRVRGAP